MSEPEPDRTHAAYLLNMPRCRKCGYSHDPDENCVMHVIGTTATTVPVPASAVSDRSDEQAGGTPEVPPGTSEGSDLDEECDLSGWYASMLDDDVYPRNFDGTPYFVTDPETGGMKAQKLARFSQIPPDVLLELAEHFGKGELKYPNDEDGKANWQRGYSWRLSVDALGRHLLAFLAGENIDPDSGSSHLIAVMWHCATLRYFQIHDKGRDYRD